MCPDLPAFNLWIVGVRQSCTSSMSSGNQRDKYMFVLFIAAVYCPDKIIACLFYIMKVLKSKKKKKPTCLIFLFYPTIKCLK